MDRYKTLGICSSGEKPTSRKETIKYINLKLKALGSSGFNKDGSSLGVVEDLIRNYRERHRLFKNAYVPSDQRIQDFLNSYFSELPDDEKPKLP